MLRETDASPALRSASYQVAAGLPGVEALGTVADHSGRSEVGVAYVNKGLRHELIFDPKTSALLGESYTIVGPGSGYDAPDGTAVGWEVYLHSSVVNSLPSAPATAPSQPVAPATPVPSSSATCRLSHPANYHGGFIDDRDVSTLKRLHTSLRFEYGVHGPPADVYSIWYTCCTSKTVPVRELRAELSQVIDKVADLREHVIVTRHGRPVAVLVPVDEYEALEETAEILSDAETMTAIDEGRREVERGETVTLEDLRRELQSRRRR